MIARLGGLIFARVMSPLNVIAGGGGYAFRPLSQDQVDIAYPLIREQFRALSVAQWRHYAERLIAEQTTHPIRGISVAERPKHYLRALFSYHVVPDIEHGDKLVIDCVAVPDALDGAAVAGSLVAAIRTLAREYDCKGVNAQLGARNAWLAPIFESAGYAGHVYYRSEPNRSNGT